MSSMVPLSPSEHQLTPALFPIWGPRPKPPRPEEVVHSLKYSCSHFTQCLFPPKLPQQHTCTTFIIHSSSFILIIHHIHTSNYTLLLHDRFISSFLRFFIAGQLPWVSCVRYKYKYQTSNLFNSANLKPHKNNRYWIRYGAESWKKPETENLKPYCPFEMWKA